MNTLLLTTYSTQVKLNVYVRDSHITCTQGGPSRQDFDSDRDRRMIKSDMRSRDFARGADIGGPPSMGSVNKFGNTFGLSTVFLESLGITGPLVSKVFVANVSVQYKPVLGYIINSWH